MVGQNLAMVQTLIEAGADIHLTDQFGLDAFQHILSLEVEENPDQGDVLKALQLLIAHGVDINAALKYEQLSPPGRGDGVGLSWR